VVYENGPLNGNAIAWALNFGYAATNSFAFQSSNTVLGFDFYAWEAQGDTALSVDWSITDQPFGGNTYGSGTAQLTDAFLTYNQYGYQIDKISVTGLSVPLPAGTFWLNLQNAVMTSGGALYWDENSGVGCQSPGCPSLADENTIGTIPSESFDVTGAQCSGNCCDSSSDKSQYAEPQDLKVIYRFSANQAANALSTDRAGNIYGTASGYNGTPAIAFELSNYPGNWVLTPLLAFEDDEGPKARLLDPYGALYGIYACRHPDMCVFNLKPQPTAPRAVFAPWLKTDLYAYPGGTEVRPNYTDLAFGRDNDLYGTGVAGGMYGYGGIYKLTPGPGGWTQSVLYSFTDLEYPSGVVMDKNGNLYGTTLSGGAYDYGTVFQLTPGAGGWSMKILHSFQENEGDNPSPTTGLIFDDSGNLYGATVGGLPSVFKLTPSNGDWTFSIFHVFDEHMRGPEDRMVFDGFNLYGPLGEGVFRLSVNGDYTLLQRFCKEGSTPTALTLDGSRNLYGVSRGDITVRKAALSSGRSCLNRNSFGAARPASSS
jgi:uncharacterized repeat protein (TIGR03803 family)